MSKNIYLTTAIPYVNGAPHIGHTLDYLLADTYSRYQKQKGSSVRFQAGTDEHGNKIYKKATENGVKVEEYVAENSQKFRDFIQRLGVEYTDFIRTTDQDHERRVQEIWQKLAPHIYKDSYEGWYCEGCERFVTENEYEENEGVCPDHQKPYEKLEEENYYLRIADFKDQIKAAIEKDEIKILPEFRKKEMLKLLEDTPDVSISRPKKQLTWGVPVPGDDTQVMYVWMDALANYITVLGYPDNDISDFWPASVQIVGKDILRFHSIIWPAMLLGLGLPLPKVLLSHGFVLTNGAKMSKSLGNVVEPNEVLDKYGLPAFRYYFLRHADTFADADFTWEKYDAAYNNELANDLGNLVQRLATLCKKSNIVGLYDYVSPDDSTYDAIMSDLYFSKAFDYVWGNIQALNKRIDDEKPWVLVKEGKSEQAVKVLTGLVKSLLDIATMLAPFLPDTAEKIKAIFTAEAIAPPKSPLFPKHK